MSGAATPNTTRVSGIYQLTPPAVTDNSLVELRVDSLGRVRVVAEGPSGPGTASQVEGTQPAGAVSTSNPIILAGVDSFGRVRPVNVDPNGKVAVRTLIDGDIELSVNDRITIFCNTSADGTGVPLVPVVNLAGNLQVGVVSEQATATIGLPAGSTIKVVGGNDDLGNAKAIRQAFDGTVRVDPTGTTVQPVSISGTVIVIPTTGGSPLVEYNSTAAVPANAETTIVSYIVPLGQQLNLAACVGSGDVGSCRYTVYINGVLKLVKRTQLTEPSAELDFKGTAPVVSAGQIVMLRVTHYATGKLGNFDGTIMGTLV